MIKTEGGYFMKKLLSVILAALLMLSAIPALAEDDMQRTLGIIKERIGPTDEFDEFRSSEMSDCDGNTTYNFYWSSSNEENDKRMRITALSGGIITNYHFYDSAYDGAENKATINRPSYDEARKKAAELLKTLNPDVADKLVLSTFDETESIGGGDFVFRLQRTENGIPVRGDDGSVSVSEKLDRITDMSLTYTAGASFPSPDGTIAQEAAKEAFKSEIGMEMQYKTKYEWKKNERTVYPVYVVKKYNTYIDAFTGKAREINQSPILYRNSGGGDAKESAQMAADFSEAELKEIENIAGLLSLDEVEKQLRGNSLLNIGSKMKLESHSLFSDGFEKDKYIYSLSFEKDEYAYASVDAKTGELISFRRSFEADEKKKISADKAEKLAAEIAEKLAPEHISADGSGDYVYRKNDSDSYSYIFVRTVNSVPYPDNAINITLNPSDGTLINYNFGFYNVGFPSVENCITDEQACEKLFERYGMRLEYIPEYTTDPKLYSRKLSAMTLCYSPSAEENWTVRADNGEPDKKKPLTVADYTDMSGHYAEKAATELKRYGIGFSAAELQPGKAITEKEFGNLIVNVFKWHGAVVIDDPDCTDYQSAERSGIFGKGKKAGDGSITRIEAAQYIIRALGIEEYAKLPGTFVSKFSDVSEEYAGVAAILSGMKVISGNEAGLFNPDGVLSRADALVIVYNYLSR